MSNLETKPAEIVLGDGDVCGFELLEPRDVPLGGPRAMEVRRTLPQRARSLIGAWCFVDHYGPDAVSRTQGMNVPPHPHTGLQTVSWLFAGEIEHRDSTGAHAMVRPGELNLMTAGSGIQHSEVSTTATTVLHGAQLWVALPDSDRHTTPFFEHYSPTPIRHEGATVSVFIGSLLGETSTATAFTPLLGAQIDIPAGTTVRVPVDATFEHGVLLDAGALSVAGQDIPVDNLAYFATGRDELVFVAGDAPVRALLIGGVPLGESIVMWWNFIGRTHDEIAQYRQQWQAEVIEPTTVSPTSTELGMAPPATQASDTLAAGTSSATSTDPGTASPAKSRRFGRLDGYPGSALPAPTLPNVRLRPRE
jgi:redox-sensitive bicupin YhaK (pirin superfamily)